MDGGKVDGGNGKVSGGMGFATHCRGGQLNNRGKADAGYVAGTFLNGSIPRRFRWPKVPRNILVWNGCVRWPPCS